MEHNQGRLEFNTEMNLIKEQLGKEEAKTSSMQRYKELFTDYRRVLFLGVSLQIFQQLTGINAATYYGPNMMKQAGFGDDTNKTSVHLLLSL
jgi:MFS transporter, SP family, arabinose:H+ symporter